MTAVEPPRDVDWHNWLLQIALNEKKPAPGDWEDYLTLSGRGDDIGPEAAFDLFIKRWVHPQWWSHLLDNDDNEAEYVRRWIRGEYPR